MLGKFVSQGDDTGQMECLTTYIIYNEFLQGDIYENRGKKETAGIQSNAYVSRILLAVLSGDIKKTESNFKFMGSLFKPFAQPLIRCSIKLLQMQAVQFISKWLPMTNQDSGVLGMDALMAGLNLVNDLLDLDDHEYTSRKHALLKRKHEEECKIATRSRLIRQLLLPPGTWTGLDPINGRPGYFLNLDACMINTTGIIAKLPIHARSAVTVSRPIPPVPGTPNNVTTIPTVFMGKKMVYNIIRRNSME